VLTGDLAFRYSADRDVAYISIADRNIVATRELTPNVIVDLDEDGGIVGVELLSLRWLMDRPRLAP
jgi:uncharacterized protein YuzE